VVLIRVLRDLGGLRGDEDRGGENEAVGRIDEGSGRTRGRSRYGRALHSSTDGDGAWGLVHAVQESCWEVEGTGQGSSRRFLDQGVWLVPGRGVKVKNSSPLWRKKGKRKKSEGEPKRSKKNKKLLECGKGYSGSIHWREVMCSWKKEKFMR